MFFFYLKHRYNCSYVIRYSSTSQKHVDVSIIRAIFNCFFKDSSVYQHFHIPQETYQYWYIIISTLAEICRKLCPFKLVFYRAFLYSNCFPCNELDIKMKWEWIVFCSLFDKTWRYKVTASSCMIDVPMTSRLWLDTIIPLKTDIFEMLFLIQLQIAYAIKLEIFRWGMIVLINTVSVMKELMVNTNIVETKIITFITPNSKKLI